MSNKFVSFHQRASKCIDANFKNVVEFEGRVDSISENKDRFTIVSYDGQHRLECRTGFKDGFEKNQSLVVKGKIRFDDNSVYLQVKYFYCPNADKSNAFEDYQKMCNTLNNKKILPLVKKIHRDPMPKIAYNIGIIAMPNDEFNLNSLKIVFRQKCKGNLFIYRLKDNNIHYALENAIEYFKKYHQIHVICLLTNHITISQMYQLSSKNNVGYLLRRKKTPHLISVVHKDIDHKPLTALLSNQSVSNVHQFVDLCHQKQLETHNNLTKAVQLGTKRLFEIVQIHQERLQKFKERVNSLSDVRFLTMGKDSLIERFKLILSNNLHHQKYILYHQKMCIVNDLLEDSRITKVVETISFSETEFSEVMKAYDPDPHDKKIENNLTDDIDF